MSLIVDTIGSVDDLIENYASQIQILITKWTTQINELNESSALIPLTTLCSFERGKEMGSKIIVIINCQIILNT